ncbi:type VI secretion system baseplate subunit TssE [Sphingomonas radiodurans]|uniref:type VI secretion system baseplate subunit TssE n=1 Tax=Sphingomonas radiodurans TaxID=2890321 RepID=UPI001E46FDA6|nr:type VI secretion system baseplate subunit TssE [Sphingomonas radiodurans]WBH16699.1 type VI secretion system baseplate subunit TssE [Sphingomonas radiodurans]
MARTFTHSLIDRLIDDEPDRAVEPAESEEAALARYKYSLRRDLEALLNSKRPLLAMIDASEALGRTVIGYGIRDMSTDDFSTSATRERARRMVAQCIREHETRLSDVDVEADSAPTSRGIRFRITATLKLSRNRDVVVYDANVRPTDRAIAVELTGS